MIEFNQPWKVVGLWLRGKASTRKSRPVRSGVEYAMSGWESLESRELLSTTQTFEGTGGTNYSLQQVAGPPQATILSGGPTGNFLRLATTPTSPVVGNNNSISFVTSDTGAFNEATAAWDFRVTPTAAGGNGVGMSFALLNTTNYGTSGQAASIAPQQGIYDGSLAFGFDTTNDLVYLSLNSAIVTGANLTGTLNLASGVFIHAQAQINFEAATVSLVLTPTGGSAVTVFNSTTVSGLGPYQSRVSFQADNSTTSYADFDLDNVSVVYSGARLAGTISFSSSSYAVYENQPQALITIARTGGTAGTFTVNFVSADGSARNGVNYESVAGFVTFPDGVASQTIAIPIIDDHLSDGNKLVNLYIGNPQQNAPIASPIVATLTIVNTDPPAPTVSPSVQAIYLPHTRRVEAFRLQFSQPMNAASATNLSNYEVLLPPARRNGPVRLVTLTQAVLDPSGMVVTLTRANLAQHLTRYVRIVVRGKPTTGLISSSGTFLAGTGGVSGTDAALVVSS